MITDARSKTVGGLLLFRNVELCEYPFRPLALELCKEISDRGLPFKVWETYRATTTQQAYYAKGRTEPGPKVTNARPGFSAHEWGFALDLVLDIPKINPWDTSIEMMGYWQRMGDLVERKGLEWGGNWRFKDYPHIQLKNWRQHRPSDWKTLVRYRLGG